MTASLGKSVAYLKQIPWLWYQAEKKCPNESDDRRLLHNDATCPATGWRDYCPPGIAAIRRCKTERNILYTEHGSPWEYGQDNSQLTRLFVSLKNSEPYPPGERKSQSRHHSKAIFSLQNTYQLCV